MKIFGLNWREVLDTLPEWEALSPGARLAFLEVKPSQGIAASGMGAALREVEAAGMLATAAKRAVAVQRYHALLVALRAMQRHPLLEYDDEMLLATYLQEHFTDDELRRITGRPTPGYSWVERRSIALLAASANWVREFLAVEGARAIGKWEAPRLTPGEAPRLSTAGTAEALQALIGSLAGHPLGVPLRELRTLLPGLDDEARAAVLEAGIRYLLLFPTLRSPGDEALVGLLPRVAERLGPPPPPPAPVEAAESFEGPFLVGDMTTVLVEAATTPIPLRGGDGGMYVRAQKLLAPRLQPIPSWVGSGLDPDEFDEEDEGEERPGGLDPFLVQRLIGATRILLNFGLARAGTDEDGKYQLSATAAGERWLGLAEGERVRELLNVFRASGERNPATWRGATTGREFFSTRLSFELAKGRVDLRAALTEAFLSIPAGSVVPLDGFIRFHALSANPFLAHGSEALLGRTGYSSMDPVTPEAWEELWAQILHAFVLTRLFPFGGARMGRAADGELCLGLTEVGRYLLGATDEFEFAPPPAGEVVVQPDFEILFLAPAPRLEPELARLADRIGSGVGALFRITRASVLRAAEQGITADNAVALLEEVSRSGVPANVARQIRDWVGGTRRVSLQTALLIECPDPETAARVLALTSGHGALVTPTLIRLPAQALERKTLVKKLRDKGIFLAS